MYNVLFVCIHNSARSQMAEAFLNNLGGGKFRAESAGIEKGKLNPYIVLAMKEVEIDISKNETKEALDLFRKGRLYNAVITVCEKEAAERCPVFPGKVKRIAWSFPDPSRFGGSDEEILTKVRVVRDEIRQAVVQFIEVASNPDYWMENKIYESN
jgi:arsenate reductase